MTPPAPKPELWYGRLERPAFACALVTTEVDGRDVAPGHAVEQVPRRPAPSHRHDHAARVRGGLEPRRRVGRAALRRAARRVPARARRALGRAPLDVSLDSRGELEPYYVSIDPETARHPQALLATHHG